MKRVGFVFVFLMYLLAIFIGGCRAKKSVQVETKKKDSIYYRVESVKAPILSDVLELEMPCDSVEVVVEGKTYKAPPKVRPFRYEFQIDSLIVELQLTKKALTLSKNQKEKTISELEQRLELREREVKELRNTVKVRTDWRLVLILAGVIVLFVAYPKIPSLLNKVIRQIL